MILQGLVAFGTIDDITWDKISFCPWIIIVEGRYGMTEFIKLKKECADLLTKVKVLYHNLCEDIYFQDIHKMEHNLPGRIVKKDGDYYLDDCIRIGVTTSQTDSILEFEDRRATPFLWVFTAEMPSFYTTDTFIVDKLPYSVSLLREGKFDDGEDKIREVISKLQDTLKKLNSKPGVDSVSYTYVCVEPDVECKDIMDAVDKVIKRKPINW